MSCKPTTLATKYATSIINRGGITDVAFTRGLYAFDIILREQNPANKYDRDDLLEISKKVTALKNNTILNNYPSVSDRLQQRDFTYIEVADFLQQSGFTSDKLKIVLNAVDSTNTVTFTTSGDVSQLLNQLEAYITNNIAASVNSGTCSALQIPFTKATELLTKLQDSADRVKRGLATTSSIIGELNSIRSVLMKIVDKVRDILLSKIEQFKGQIAGFVAQARGMGMQLLTKFRSMVEDAKAFLEDLSIEYIKIRIDEFLVKAVQQFEELTPDVLSLLFFKFCQFSEMIQSFMEAPVKALQKTVNRFSDTNRRLETHGMTITEQVAANGGVRLRSREIDESRKRMTRLANERPRLSTPRGVTQDGVIPGGNPSLITSGMPAAQPGLQIPAYIEDGVVTEEQANAILNMRDSGIPGYVKFESGVSRMHTGNGRGTITDAAPGDGYKRVKDEVWIKLIKALDMIPSSKPVTIVSAYRSPQYNRLISGSASRSYHMSGMALDVSYSGLDVAAFICACSIQNFGAIQTYNSDNFVHIDIAPKRNWSGNGADGIGGTYKKYLQAHANGNGASVSDLLRNSGVAGPAETSGTERQVGDTSTAPSGPL